MIFKVTGAIGGGIFVTALFLIVALLLSAAFWGLILMWLLHVLFVTGVVSAHWALGYRTCFLIGIPLSFILG